MAKDFDTGFEVSSGKGGIGLGIISESIVNS